MTEHSKLVKALRCELHYTSCPETNCKYICHDTFCDTYRLMMDSAAAIEALLKKEALLKENIKGLIEDRPELVEADGHWEWRKPNGEVLMPKRGELILTNDEIETIRIHMNAIKEQLCNQCRHREAEAYQTIVDKLAKMEVQE